MDGEVPPVPAQILGGDKKKERKQVSPAKVIVIGLSHKTASVDVREKLAVQEHDWQKAAHQLVGLPSIKEAAVISTCNRFELYLVSDNIHACVREVTESLSIRSGVGMTELRDSLFMLSEEEAVWHALRVSSGLDSLVIGEGQILSQMKRCYELATEPEGAAGKVRTAIPSSLPHTLNLNTRTLNPKH
jgi:glutamyl-tRNA reductase